MATEIITSFIQLDDSAGVPMSGALVYVYDVGTTTLRNIYSDTALGNAAANPIVADSAGRHDMRYTATGSYKIVVKTSAGATVLSRDNIDGRVPIGSGALAIANGGTGATSAPAALSNLGAATSAEVAVIAAQLATLSGTLSSVEKTHIATGTTAQRPGTPIEGDIRRNTTTTRWEQYNGTAWENVAVFTTTSSRPTIQRFLPPGAGTYTLPTGCLWIRVRIIGAGGGGGGATANNGAVGGDTNFSTWTAIHGNGGVTNGGAGGTGGTGGVNGTGTLIHRINGQGGMGGTTGGTTPGGAGGSSVLGGGGIGASNAAGGAAAPVSGSGGCGGGGSAGNSGGGGGAGEFVEFIITAPSATYSYTVGAGGAGGAAGTRAGGDGSDGTIIVEEYYIG